MDGVQLASLEVAPLKATTAIRFKRPSKAMNDPPVGDGTRLLSLPRTLPIDGGWPIGANGTRSAPSA